MRSRCRGTSLAVCQDFALYVFCSFPNASLAPSIARGDSRGVFVAGRRGVDVAVVASQPAGD